MYSQSLIFACRDLDETRDFEKFLQDLSDQIDYQDPIQVSMLNAIANVKHDNSSLNDWLFSVPPPDYQQPILWIAKITNTNPARYVWAVGTIHPNTSMVRKLFSDLGCLENNEFLKARRQPPFMMFIDPLATSIWQLEDGLEEIDNTNDFDLFQVNKAEDESKIEDLEFLLAMNSSFIEGKAAYFTEI